MPLFFLGTREWRNRQTRTVQVRVPVMEWGFNSPLAHDETADPSGSAVFVFPGCGCGAACGPMGVPSAAWGRAALWGPAAVCAGGRRPAREIATREPDGSEWSISRPALALPPPTGTAAVPSGPSGALHIGGTCVAWTGPAATHRHRGRALRSLLRPPHRRRSRNSRLSLVLAAPLVFWALSGPAAREIATREPEGSEWSISKPARALRTLRRPPHRRRLVC